MSRRDDLTRQQAVLGVLTIISVPVYDTIYGIASVP